MPVPFPMPDFRGYHDCPCRDCFEIAIGGARDENGDEDPTLPALCSECEEHGCSPDGDEECNAPGAYGGCVCEDGEACDECSPNDGADLILAMEGE